MITNPDKKRRALGLLSGSLDSYIAFHLMLQQSVLVDAIVFTSPFFDTSMAQDAARTLGVNLITHDITSRIVQALTAWDGQQHICDVVLFTILSEARSFMASHGYDFIFSGEVVRQHSDQMTPEVLDATAKEAGLEGLLVRPLCAKHLLPTHPETAGWISSEFLEGWNGHNRHDQKRMGRQLNILDFVATRNTSRLRDPVFKQRVLDLLEHNALGGINYLKLLHIGRHFRLDRDIKLVLGRNENENAEIEGSAELYDLLIRLVNKRGPTGLLPYTATDEHIKTAAAICARYGDTQQQTPVHVRIRSPRQAQDIAIEPARRELIETFRI